MIRRSDASKFPYMSRLDQLAAAPCARSMGLRPGLQENRAAIGADYAFGYESVGGFQKAFEDCGGQIVQKIWPPLGAKDFGPTFRASRPDAGRRVLADGRADGAAIPQAAPPSGY